MKTIIEVLLGIPALVVKGDKGRADKKGEELLHVFAQSAAVLHREHVLQPRTILPWPIPRLATVGIILFQRNSDLRRELFL